MPCKAGTNRVVWDMTYPGPVSFPGIVLRYANANDGPPAPPGTYGVRLTAAGRTETRPLRIQRDPRVSGVTDADLQKQFQLAIKIRDKVSQANRMVIRIREIRSQIEERKKQLSDPSVSDVATALEAKLGAVEETLYQVRNRSPRDTLNYPIKLNNQLAVLQRGVGMGDYPPTDQDAVVFQELSDKLNALSDSLATTLGADLKRLNDAFTAHGLPPLDK